MAEALEAAQGQARKDEEAALENLRSELDNKTKDECEKVRLESMLIQCTWIIIFLYKNKLNWEKRHCITICP